MEAFALVHMDRMSIRSSGWIGAVRHTASGSYGAKVLFGVEPSHSENEDVTSSLRS